MKNLIEEIDLKLKNARCVCRVENEGKISKAFALGQVEGYEDCLNILNQYNIITAPKSIKLSEIVERLKEEQTDYEFRYKEGSISVWKNRWCYAMLGIDDDTLKLDFDIHDRYLFPKWLFAMWIAGTEIIDDMEVLDND